MMNQSNNLKIYNKLLTWAIILQCIQLPSFIGPLMLSLSQFSFFSKLFEYDYRTINLTGLFLECGFFIYFFRWYYLGVVIIEGVFLLVFLFKTGDPIDIIKKGKKKYIWLLVLLICNLFAVFFYYDLWQAALSA